MANVLYVIHMCALAPWLEFVMNVIMGPTKEDVSYAVGLVCLMHIIVKSALCKKKM